MSHQPNQQTHQGGQQQRGGGQKKDDQRRQQPNQKPGQGEPVAPEYRESDQGGESEPGGVGPKGGTHTVPDDETRGV
jgi:hypothetical protein